MKAPALNILETKLIESTLRITLSRYVANNPAHISLSGEAFVELCFGSNLLTLNIKIPANAKVTA